MNARAGGGGAEGLGQKADCKLRPARANDLLIYVVIGDWTAPRHTLAGWRSLARKSPGVCRPPAGDGLCAMPEPEKNDRVGCP